MNIKPEELDLIKFERLVNLLNNRKISRLTKFHFSQEEVVNYKKDSSNSKFLTDNLEEIIKLKDELKVKWIDTNLSTVFLALGSWVDASWGIAKVFDPSKFNNSSKDDSLHEWKKIADNDWYYYLNE